MCGQLYIQHVLTTSFYSQSNGMVEREHRQIEDALCAREVGAAWLHHLQWLLLELRAAPKEYSRTSSAELVMGASLENTSWLNATCGRLGEHYRRRHKRHLMRKWQLTCLLPICSRHVYVCQ